MKRRNQDANEMSLTGHLKELRKVLLVSAYAIAAGTVAGWILSPYVYQFLAAPAVKLQMVTFITLAPMEPILVKLKMALVIGFFVALPVIFWQLWSFILPALKQTEKRYVYTVAPWSIVLFIAGAAFCYYVVLPIGLRFFLSSFQGVQAENNYSIAAYLSFVLTFLVGFGFIFQLPVVLLQLIKFGFLSPYTLAKYRKYAFFGIVVAAVLISPTPDLWTQFLMIGPMYILYEVSIRLGQRLIKEKEKREAKKAKASDAPKKGGACE